MADRPLSFSGIRKVFEAHGCRFQYNKKNRQILIFRGTRAEGRVFPQHAHYGEKDTFDRRIVAAMRRRLGLDAMDDDEFYAPLE